MTKYHRSIKLGLSQYMGNVAQARRFIHGETSLFSFEGKNIDGWLGFNSWLHIFFNKSLFIVGLALDESEIFLRWLLIDRAKYFRQKSGQNHKGWFITKRDSKNKYNEGQRLFLNSVGIEVIEFNNYKNIYESMWS